MPGLLCPRTFMMVWTRAPFSTSWVPRVCRKRGDRGFADAVEDSTTVGPQQTPIPRRLRFLADTFGDDAEGQQMIDYVHLLLGYSITGDVGAQILPFLYG